MKILRFFHDLVRERAGFPRIKSIDVEECAMFEESISLKNPRKLVERAQNRPHGNRKLHSLWDRQILSAFASALVIFSANSLSGLTQTLTYTVPTVQSLSVTGNPTMNFSAPTAGSDFTSITDSSTTYSVTSNLGAGKGYITAALSSGTIPTGLTMLLSLAVPSGSGASAASPAIVSTTASQTLLSGINNGAYANSAITYTLSARVATAAVTASSNFGVTFTLLSS